MPNRQTEIERQATITDVATRAGVSKKTVSRVINDEANVSIEKRERVKQAISDLGFTPNAAARHFARRRLNNIGIVVADLPRWSYYSDVIIGVHHECQKHNYTTSIHPIGKDLETSLSALNEALRSGALAGLILTAPWSSDRDFLKKLEEWKANFVCILSDSDKATHPSLIARDFEGAKNIALHLLSLGHRRFAIAAGPKGLSFSKSRLSGFMSALTLNKVQSKDVMIHFSRADYDSGFRIGSELLQTDSPPTAIFAATDIIAAGIMNSLHEKGVRIPEEISIAGYGDLQIASQVWPGLTTIHQDTEGMASAAARMAIRKAEGTVADSEHLFFGTSLIIRQSTARAPGTSQPKT